MRIDNSKMFLNWSSGNHKLKKLDTVSFNLPAFKSADGFKVCPQAGACATLCYARQGRYVIPEVQAPRERNLAIVRGDLQDFMQMAYADLGKIKQTTIRVHDSGDFFSQTYLDAWLSIAKTFVGAKRFYAYTKSLHLDFSKLPKNFQIVQSAGGLLDKLINKRKSHSKIFATNGDRIAAGYVDGNLNDGPAIRGERKIGLVYHGNKNLKVGQIRWLRAI